MVTKTDVSRKRRSPRSQWRRKKRAMVRNIPRGPRGAMLTVKRTIYSTNHVFSTAATNGFWLYYEPTLGNGFNNISEFSAVFDSYKVNAMKMTFRPRFDNLAGPTTGATPMTTVMPYITTAIDPDSRLVPTGLYTNSTLNVLLEQGNTKTRPATKDVSVYWKPKISTPTNVGTGQMLRRPGWIDLQGGTNVPFRGVHVFFHTNAFATNPVDLQWDVFITWYVQFKNLK